MLSQGDQFKIDMFQGHVVVVKDGFRYPVNPKLVKRLLDQSSAVRPSKLYQNAANSFQAFGHTLLRYVQLQASKFSNSVVSGFEDNTVYAKFDDNALMYVLRITQDTVAAQVYMPEKQQVKVLEINTAIQKIAARMSSKFNCTISDFRQLTAHVGNVKVPWGGAFSGTIYSYAAKWTKE